MNANQDRKLLTLIQNDILIKIIQVIMIVFPENPPAIEEIWIIGDETVKSTAAENFSLMNTPFMEHGFDTAILYTNKGLTGNNTAAIRSTAARILNAFINEFNRRLKLPKWVIIFLEDDLIEDIPYREFGISEIYGHLLDYLMTNFKSMVTDIQRNYPLKAVKFSYPHFLWVEPTLHVNHQNDGLRAKFIKSLHIVSKMHDNTVAIPVQLPWNNTDQEMFKWNTQKLTAKGRGALWSALDHTVRFADTKLMRNHGLFLKNIFQKQKFQSEADKRVAKWEHFLKKRRANGIQNQQQHMRDFFQTRQQQNRQQRTAQEQYKFGEKQSKRQLKK